MGLGEITAAVVGAVAGAVITALAGILKPAVLRKLEYCRNRKKNMDTLRKGVEELNQLKTGVELRKRKIRRGRMMKKEVEHWLSLVKIINEEVQVVEKLCSAIPRGCLAQAWLGETVLGKIDEVEKLDRQHGKFSSDIGIDRRSTSEAKLLCFPVKKNFKKLKVGAVKNALMGILMPAVSRKLEYCRNLKKNMNTLREEVAELNHLRDDIVELRKRKINMMKKEVEHWLSGVKTINKHVQDVENSCSAGSRGCPAKASLGETVLRRIDEVQKLRQQGKFFVDIMIDRQLDKLNRQKKEVETLKRRHENAGEVVREEVNDWLIDVRSINAVIQILEDASPLVSPCDRRKFDEIVLEKNNAVNDLHQRGTFPDGIVIDNRRKPKRG